MNMKEYTQKSQEAMLTAQQLAKEYQHQIAEPIHLLLAVCRRESSFAPKISIPSKKSEGCIC
jgi:ATP-dependent Clp protease ATP-binding subunit ClpA